MKTIFNAVRESLIEKTGPGSSPPSVDDTPQLKEIATEALNADLLKASYELADRAYDIQWGKDGIEDTQAKLTGLQGKVGEVVYAIAKLAYDYCANVPGGHGLSVARQYFLKLCEAAERHIISRDIEMNSRELPITKLVPLWPQYKTSIAKGMEKGIDPMARDPATITEKSPKGSLLYPTAAAYRAKVQAIEAQERGANERETDKPADRKEKEAALSVVVSGLVQPLKAAMGVMYEQLNRLTHEDQMQFVQAILEISGKAKTLADQRMREAAGDTRTAAQKAAQPMTADQLASKLKEDRSEQDPDAGTTAALQSAVDAGAKGPQAPAKAADAPKGARNAKRA